MGGSPRTGRGSGGLFDLPEITFVTRGGRPSRDGTTFHISTVRGTLENLIAALAGRVGVADYRVLHSEEEFKKSSMEYF
jgi:hypothetical protein